MRSTGSRALASSLRSSPIRLDTARTESVGRKGTLTLEYVYQGGRTVFGRTNCQTPWHLLPPIYLDESGSAYTLLVNPSGGLVGDDHLSIDLSIGRKAHVLISTPSANRVYRSLAREAVQDVTIDVGEEGILEWMPEHTIPFAGSRFRQSIDVKLRAGATLILWDAVASGRIARGERWKFATLENHIRITTPSGAAVMEHYVFSPEDKKGAIGLAETWDYVGSLFVVGDTVSAALWTSLESALAEILDKHGKDGGVLAGVSQPAVPGVVIKLVAKSAPAMNHLLMEMWATVRQVVLQLQPAVLRKY